MILRRARSVLGPLHLLAAGDTILNIGPITRGCLSLKSIRQLREEAGWTQLELAYKLGVTPSTIHNWEVGRFEPTASKLRQLAHVFGVSMDVIDFEQEQGKLAA